jgi:hypothetical protein
MSALYHNYFVQQGSSRTYQVDHDDYMVLSEAWGGYLFRQLLNTTVIASYPPTPEGKTEAEKHAADLTAERERKEAQQRAISYAYEKKAKQAKRPTE